MKPYRSYHSDLMKELKNPQEAIGYLNAALEDGDAKVFLLALRDVTEAQGNMSRIAKKCEVHRASIYRMTSREGNPGIANVMRLIGCIGFNFRVVKSGKRKTALGSKAAA